MDTSVIATNRKAFRDYFIMEQYECGIELKGAEVKAIRAGHVHFKDSFARAEGAEVFLYNLHIDPYAQASYMNPESDRVRKLLLHKKEIKKILAQTTQKGLTLIPLKIYFNQRNFAKVSVGLAKGKKFYDKREDMKKRDEKKQIDRAIKSGPRRR
jgi:SsrA-binding protein